MRVLPGALAAGQLAKFSLSFGQAYRKHGQIALTKDLARNLANWPSFGQVYRNLAKLPSNKKNLARNLAHWPSFGQVYRNLPKLLSNKKTWPETWPAGQILAKFTETWPNCFRQKTNLVRNLANWPSFGQVLAKFIEAWPNCFRKRWPENKLGVLMHTAAQKQTDTHTHTHTQNTQLFQVWVGYLLPEGTARKPNVCCNSWHQHVPMPLCAYVLGNVG